MANPLVGGAQAVGQALNSTGGKLLGLGVLASASDDLLKTAKGAISGGGMFGGPGGVPSNALENLTQTELFAGTTSGVRNFFVGILEFFKVIRDLWTGEVSFSDIMSGKISATEALSSAKTREDSPPNALENTYDSVASTVENVIPDFADGGNKHLALAESGALAYMGYRGVKAYRNSGKTSTLSEDSTKKASNMDGNDARRVMQDAQLDADKPVIKKSGGGRRALVAGIATAGAGGVASMAFMGASTQSAEAAENDQFSSPSGTPAGSVSVDYAALAEYGAEGAFDAIAASNVAAMGMTTRMMLKEGTQAGFKACAKRVPILGGIVTAGFTAYSAGSYALAGDYKRATAELAAGAAESAVNFTGAGLIGGGDAAREAVRAGFIAAAGEEWTAEKSDIRILAGKAIDLAQGISRDAGETFSPNPLHNTFAFAP